MKPFLLTIASLFFAAAVIAQPVISAFSNTPEPGDDVRFVRTGWINPGNGGTNCVWDFSGIELPEETRVSQILSLDTDNGTKVPGYTHCVRENDQEHFYRNDETSSSKVGVITGNYILQYDDPMMVMVYPFAFGDSFTDSYAWHAQAETGNPVDFIGQTTVTADGTGTLILPQGTFYNVLRVKNESAGLEIHHCNTYEVKVTRYLWYAPGMRYPLVNINDGRREVGGAPDRTNRFAMFRAPEELQDIPSPPAPGNDKSNETASKTGEQAIPVGIYPNPFEQSFQYHYFLKQETPVKVTMTDVLGNPVATLEEHALQAAGLRQGSFDATGYNLQPGVYFVRFTFGKEAVVRKVVRM